METAREYCREAAAKNTEPKESGKYRDIYQFITHWYESAPPNVWLGVSVENQAMADLRIPQLLEIPAAVRFLSCEPLLEKVDLGSALRAADNGASRQQRPTVDWVIVGGESGKDRRDCGVEAICNVAVQCTDASVPVYVKQDCDFKSGQQGRLSNVIWRLKQFPEVNGARGATRPTLA